MGRLTTTTSVAAAVAIALAGCGKAEPPSASTPTASATESATPTLTTPAPRTSAPQTGPSAGLVYTVTRTAIEGDSPDGRGSWTTDYGLLSGGDPRVVQAFNGASQAAAQDQVDAAIDSASDGTRSARL
jgi:hypothetical protein